MGFFVGNSLLTASISNDRINEMLITHSPPRMTLWGKIKDFFFTTGERDALECLFKLCNPTPNLTRSEVEYIFFRLKELVSPGYKEIFCHENIDNPSTGKLHIKDENAGNLLYVEIIGELCNYNILGKTFIFENTRMPFFTQKHETNTHELSIIFQKIKPQSLTENIKWMRDYFYCVSYKNNKLSLDFNAFYDEIINYITSMHKGNDFHLWLEEEKETYISAVINKEIDNQISNKSINLSKRKEDDIFNCVKNSLGIYNLQLKSTYAQSSIKHYVLRLISKKEYWHDFINKCSTDRNIKNIITTDMVNTLSNHIFENLFMAEMKLPDEWINIIRTSVCDQYMNK